MQVALPLSKYTVTCAGTPVRWGFSRRRKVLCFFVARTVGFCTCRECLEVIALWPDSGMSCLSPWRLRALLPSLPETRLQQAIQVENARRLGSFQPTGTVYAATVPTNYIEPTGNRPPTAGPSGYTGWALEPATWISNHGCVGITVMDMHGVHSSCLKKHQLSLNAGTHTRTAWIHATRSGYLRDPP